MKKTLFFVILFFVAGHFLNAQAPCINDVEYSLVSLKQVPKAKKMFDECFPGNESSAKAWLVRANVYIQYYTYELDRKNKDSKYTITTPDAIITANESFYKVLELNPDLKASPGLLDSKDGQLLSAPPIHDLAAAAMEKKDYTEAAKLLNLVIRSYRADVKGSAKNLVFAYFDLANCYKDMGDDANYKKTLIDAIKLNVPEPVLYLKLYDIYKKDFDTVKCGEILTQAKKAIPDSLALNVKAYELDYYAMIGDSAKLIDAALKMYEKNKNNIEVIIMVSGYLVNGKLYTQAEEIINVGLAMDSKNFELNQLMASRFYFEAADYDRKKEELVALRKYIAAEPYALKVNEIFGTAVIWAEKAYNLKKDDRELNIMYNEILVRLMMDIPEGLPEKVNSYLKKQ
jgi:tetratricopeptide (TPR) repeat protein